MRPLSLFLCLLLSATAGASCTPTSKPAEGPLEYAENAKRDYETALEAFHDRDWEVTTNLMQEVRRKYSYSRYARLAELRIADAAFHQDKFAEAIAGYKSFVHDYPNDPEVVYARYRVALAQFRSTSQSLLLPPLEERDLAAVLDAHKSIRAFLNDYPNYKKAAELKYMFLVVKGLLARHELYVARYYLNRDNFKAAANRVEYALSNFEDTGLEPEALVLLGEVYLKMHKHAEARAAFQQVLRQYPASAFTVPARNFLAGISPQ